MQETQTAPNQCQWGQNFTVSPDTWTYPYYYWYPTITQRTYKCPCGGEFFSPVQKKRYVNDREQVYYVCPFCGEELRGMTE